MRAGITVKDIAARISQNDDPKEMARLVEKLRYWTREGLLEPSGQKHVGTGRWRTYDGDAVFVAAALAEAARYQPSLSIMYHVATEIGRRTGMETRTRRVTEAMEGRRGVFFSIYQGPNPGDTGSDIGYKPFSVPRGISEFGPPSAIVLNLTAIFNRLRSSG